MIWFFSIRYAPLLFGHLCADIHMPFYPFFQTDECPFLGEVPTGDTVQMMDNNLFRAPIVRHNPPTTDFLLIRSKNKFYIREIPAIYAVGQEQPVTEVPAPNSRYVLCEPASKMFHSR